MTALARFGAPLGRISAKDFLRPGIVVQIVIVPRRIDILTTIEGVDFEEAWDARVEAEIDGLHIPVIGPGDLLRNKRATGRAKDRLDARKLEKHSRKSRETGKGM